MRSSITIVAYLVSCGLVSAQAPAQVAIPSVVLEDQFEAVHDVRQLRGHVVVLIYGDRASASANRLLGEQLHVAFHPGAKGLPPARARLAPVIPVPGATAGGTSPDVVAVPVASIGKVPSLVRRIIRAQVKSGSPDVPVWLDFDDTMKTHFGFKAGVPNVVVLDAQGRYRHGLVGVPTGEKLAKLIGAIEALRREAVTPGHKQ